MGNKHSTAKHKESTLRSFSWQQDPALIHSSQYPGYASSGPYGGHISKTFEAPPDPYPSKSQINHRPPGHGNGSIIHDEGVFGGVSTITKDSPNKPSSGHQTPSSQRNSTPTKSPTGKSGATDSGYFTSMDSDPKQKGKVRGSRLSLNEFMTAHRDVPNNGVGPKSPVPNQRFTPGPHMNFGQGPMSPQMRGSMPPPGYLHHHRFLCNSQQVMNSQTVPINPSKKERKWLKKQQKSREHNHLAPGMISPPFVTQATFGGPAFLSPFGAIPYRYQSVDNLGPVGLIPGPAVFQPMSSRPPFRFRSQTDLSGISTSTPLFYPPHFAQHPIPPFALNPQQSQNKPKFKEKSSKNSAFVKIASNGSATGSSGKNSRRSQELTHFEEEKTEVISHEDVEKNSNPTLFQNTKRTDDQEIYATLKSRQESDSILSESQEEREINCFIQATSTPHLSRECQSQNRVLKDNEVILEKTPVTVFEKSGNVKKSSGDKIDLKSKPAPAEATKAASCWQSKSDPETRIAPVVNPVLLPETYKKNQYDDFKPLDAWQAIDVSSKTENRQPERSSTPVNDNQIPVRLNSVVPSRYGPPEDQIYTEYGNKLLDYKKKMIETECFEVSTFVNGNSNNRSDCTHSTQDAKMRIFDAENIEEPDFPVQMCEANINAKSSASPRMNQRTSDYDEKQFYDPNQSVCLSTGSATPSYMMVGDSSEIDFSWVTDMEMKLTRESWPSSRVSKVQQLEQNLPGYDRQFELDHKNFQEVNFRRRPDNNQSLSPTYYLPAPNRLSSRFSLQEPKKSYQVSHDTPSSTRNDELANLKTNVKLKAAMFEKEAEKIQQKHSRNSSSIDDSSKPFNYFGTNSDGEAENIANRGCSNERFRTSDAAARHIHPVQHKSNVKKSNIPSHYHSQPAIEAMYDRDMGNVIRSPSERKIKKIELQRRDAWSSPEAGDAVKTSHGASVANPALHSLDSKRMLGQPDLRSYQPPHMQPVKATHLDASERHGQQHRRMENKAIDHSSKRQNNWINTNGQRREQFEHQIQNHPIRPGFPKPHRENRKFVIVPQLPPGFLYGSQPVLHSRAPGAYQPPPHRF